jgi:hypothetical protein
MNLFNKKGYIPFDGSSDTGYRRPPRDPASVCDYFGVLNYLEDEGKFSHSEMAALLEDPAKFFKEV